MSQPLPPGAVLVFKDIHHAAAFWLEHWQGRGQRSSSDPRRLAGAHGRSTSAIDHEATLRAIERGLDGIHREWWAPLLIHLGWRVGVRRLQEGTFQRRAGLPEALPAGFTWRGLQVRAEQFRRTLAAARVIDAGEVAAWDSVERGEYEHAEPRTGEMSTSAEKPLCGWKAIADAIEVSEKTARQYEANEGMPVYRRGAHVFAFASELNDWLRGGRRRVSPEASTEEAA